MTYGRPDNVFVSARLYVLLRVRARRAAQAGLAPHLRLRHGRGALLRRARLRWHRRCATQARPPAQEPALILRRVLLAQWTLPREQAVLLHLLREGSDRHRDELRGTRLVAAGGLERSAQARDLELANLVGERSPRL